MKKRNLIKTIMAAAFVCTMASFAGEGTAVKGNPDSKVYHKPACKHYSAKGSTTEFATEADAVKAGYKGCKKCTASKTAKGNEKD